MGGQPHPSEDTWVAAVYTPADTYAPAGTGVVIDDHRILTCKHIFPKDDASVRLAWVSFPKAAQDDSNHHYQVKRIEFPAVSEDFKDLAVLHLAGQVPRGVTAAPLRCPQPKDLLNKQWWAFGFPDPDPIGNSADGQVGAALGQGWIRLDTGSRYTVSPGFSGGGLWSPDYEAVIGVVCQRECRGDGRAITLHQADGWFPDEKIRALCERASAADAGEEAMAAWGWSLSGDQEGTRHWRPRGRGVGIDSEPGHRFQGRDAALRAVRTWLDRVQPDQRVLVVTGAPGAGKSAVLGRIVTTADPETAGELPDSDTGVRASIGSVGCAVHAKGKTALEVTAEIARAASAAIPEQIEDLAPALRDVLSKRRRRFNVVIDALDEAASPAEARAIAGKVILPTVETCAAVGAQVVAGSWHADGDGDLLGMLGDAAQLVDLDDEEFFARKDLKAYALATLRLAGDERPGNPYDDDAAAAPVAAKIAELSEGNFLVAGLTARAHGMYDKSPADVRALSFSPKVDDAMREYLGRLPLERLQDGATAPGVTAETLLTALAFAEAPGLTPSLWRAALQALGAGDVPEGTLTMFARSSAASFLVESSGGGRQAAFRLFHQALNDALLRARARYVGRAEDEQALTCAFLQTGRDVGWEHAPAYLLRSLPAHAARAGLVDDLIVDDAFLLHADLYRVLLVADQAKTEKGQGRARLLGLTPQAITATDPRERAALFSVTDTLDSLNTGFRVNPEWNISCQGVWAAAEPRNERMIIEGRDSVEAVCAFTVNDRVCIAGGGDDKTVRLWDYRTGREVMTLKGHEGEVRAVCSINVPGRRLLASGSSDMTVRIWDPENGGQDNILGKHKSGVEALCEVTVHDKSLLASAGLDNTVRLWDPETPGNPVATLKGPNGDQDDFVSLCAVTADGLQLIAAGKSAMGGHGYVYLWDLQDYENDQPVKVLKCPSGSGGVSAVHVTGEDLVAISARKLRQWKLPGFKRVKVPASASYGGSAMCAVAVHGDDRIATATHDHAVRVWDPADGRTVAVLRGHRHPSVNAVCPVTADDRRLLASAGHDGTVRVWDPSGLILAGREPRHRGGVSSVCAVDDGNRFRLASGGDDGTVRLWDPRDGKQVESWTANKSWVRAVCTVASRDGILIAAAGGEYETRLWNPRTGLVGTLPAHRGLGGTGVLCEVVVDGGHLLATGGADGMLRLWNPDSCEPVRSWEAYGDEIDALCVVNIGEESLLATNGSDEFLGGTRILRLWDPRTGEPAGSWKAHEWGTKALCPVSMGGQSLLATSGCDDRDSLKSTVRLWDPGAAGEPVQILEWHQDMIKAMCPVPAGNRTLLASAGEERTVQLWDPKKPDPVLTIPVHHPVSSMALVADSLCIGLDAGIIAIKIDVDRVMNRPTAELQL